MVGSAVVGGVLLGLIEGLSYMMNRYMGEAFRPVDPREMPEDPAGLGEAPSAQARQPL